MQFLPVTMEEMKSRGITQPDFVYVCGDLLEWLLSQDS